MPIDWVTVAAQAVNFLLLIWLMKRFLYKPVLKAIDAREERIAKELADAKAQKTEAREEREEFQRKNEIFDQERAELMNAAAEEAKSEKNRLLEEVRSSARAMETKWRENLEKDASRLEEDFQNLVRKDVFAIVRKTLSDLAGEELEDKMTDIFLKRLEKMDEEERKPLSKGMASDEGSVEVRTAFPLTDKQRKDLGQEVKRLFSLKEEPRFEVEKDLVAGIDLSGGGQKISWTVDDYLFSLKESVETSLPGRKKTVPSPRDIQGTEEELSASGEEKEPRPSAEKEKGDAPPKSPSDSAKAPRKKPRKPGPSGMEEKDKS